MSSSSSCSVVLINLAVFAPQYCIIAFYTFWRSVTTSQQRVRSPTHTHTRTYYNGDDDDTIINYDDDGDDDDDNN